MHADARRGEAARTSGDQRDAWVFPAQQGDAQRVFVPGARAEKLKLQDNTFATQRNAGWLHEHEEAWSQRGACVAGRTRKLDEGVLAAKTPLGMTVVA